MFTVSGFLQRATNQFAHCCNRLYRFDRADLEYKHQDFYQNYRSKIDTERRHNKQ